MRFLSKTSTSPLLILILIELEFCVYLQREDPVQIIEMVIKLLPWLSAWLDDTAHPWFDLPYRGTSSQLVCTLGAKCRSAVLVAPSPRHHVCILLCHSTRRTSPTTTINSATPATLVLGVLCCAVLCCVLGVRPHRSCCEACAGWLHAQLGGERVCAGRVCAGYLR